MNEECRNFLNPFLEMFGKPADIYNDEYDEKYDFCHYNYEWKVGSARFQAEYYLNTYPSAPGPFFGIGFYEENFGEISFEEFLNLIPLETRNLIMFNLDLFCR